MNILDELFTSDDLKRIEMLTLANIRIMVVGKDLLELNDMILNFYKHVETFEMSRKMRFLITAIELDGLPECSNKHVYDSDSPRVLSQDPMLARTPWLVQLNRWMQRDSPCMRQYEAGQTDWALPSLCKIDSPSSSVEVHVHTLNTAFRSRHAQVDLNVEESRAYVGYGRIDGLSVPNHFTYVLPLSTRVIAPFYNKYNNLSERWEMEKHHRAFRLMFRILSENGTYSCMAMFSKLEDVLGSHVSTTASLESL
ncbi:MAG: hypothetical protein Q9190_007740 [Brigantiaea leucoxantha]